ncbi:stage II sporulation protein M [Thermoproteus tenax]|uniref:Uncharacterized membrane protein n=1 Tax=Thermoproteus tenax (strain ATCC 35583 / DSM 2078 / JCM 9277 / NBRC 100435 / Kra 1) TaxID=768679 RepID=G4RN38_THETK|nr:stage II sporulation protein M [Thermoproteus tenax]CCC80982.1 uncharacterized membrane protein [Thermoproteus tenax Kra 1]
MRLTLVLIVLLVEYIALAVTAYIGYTYYAAVPRWLIDTLRGQLNSTVTGPLSIFFHNLVIMTADSVPFIGPASLALSLSATGFILGVFMGYSGGGYLALALAYLATVMLPHGILELASYAFATAGSIDATRRLLSKRGGALRSWAIHYAVAAALLLAAAYIEWYEIVALRPILHSIIH